MATTLSLKGLSHDNYHAPFFWGPIAASIPDKTSHEPLMHLALPLSNNGNQMVLCYGMYGHVSAPSTLVCIVVDNWNSIILRMLRQLVQRMRPPVPPPNCPLTMELTVAHKYPSQPHLN